MPIASLLKPIPRLLDQLVLMTPKHTTQIYIKFTFSAAS
jgi:hypothetical protein